VQDKKGTCHPRQRPRGREGGSQCWERGTEQGTQRPAVHAEDMGHGPWAMVDGAMVHGRNSSAPALGADGVLLPLFAGGIKAHHATAVAGHSWCARWRGLPRV